MDKELFDKMDCFFENISRCTKPVVAFSGGIDSTLLAIAANKIFPDLPCIILVSPFLSQDELSDARQIARENALNLVEIETDELSLEEINRNDNERCYHCKKYRFSIIANWAEKHSCDIIWEGSNVDDLSDYRPGMRALSEMAGISSPLLESGFTKNDIRKLANEWRIRIWDKPSASCLATRMDYGSKLDSDILQKTEKAETIVRRFIDPKSNLRVRIHSDIVRIETDSSNFAALSSPVAAKTLAGNIKQLGFSFVTLDLCGFKSGNMNRNI